MIIGIGLCVGLLEEVRAPNTIRCLLKVAGLIPFFMMLIQDCAWHRQLFLFSFCVTMPLIALVNLIAYQNILVDNVSFASEVCWFSKAMTGETAEERERQEACDAGEEVDDCEADQDRCPMLPGGALKALVFITPIIVIVNVHFAFVLYTHYRNSHLNEEQGGCNDGEGYVDQEDEE